MSKAKKVKSKVRRPGALLSRTEQKLLKRLRTQNRREALELAKRKDPGKRKRRSVGSPHPRNRDVAPIKTPRAILLKALALKRASALRRKSNKKGK